MQALNFIFFDLLPDMGNDNILTDDYVAELLAKDAKNSSIKYSSLGLEAFTNLTPPANKPKPNTRFLRNIIKDTDSHNAALLAKEAAEARARLRDLGRNENREARASRTEGDIRRRQLGDIAAILGGKPRKRARVGPGGRRVDTSKEDEVAEAELKNESRKHRDRRDDRAEDAKPRTHMSHHRRHRSVSNDRDRRREDRRRSHSRSRSPRDHRKTKVRYRDRSRSPRECRKKESKAHDRSSKRRKRSRSTSTQERRETARESARHRKDSPRSAKELEKQVKLLEESLRPEDDSDPLDDIIGPRPPPVPEVRTKGRGTISSASGIDLRFSANYDPKTDVQLDLGSEEDWDQAVEAFRDRQKFKIHGAERLRAAGFTDEQIQRWKNGGEKREENVKWAKKGESREWDRGKVLDDEGGVSIDLEFGRLKDT